MENLSLKDHPEGDKESTVQGDGGNTQISNPTGGFLKLLPTEGEEMQVGSFRSLSNRNLIILIFFFQGVGALRFWYAT